MKKALLKLTFILLFTDYMAQGQAPSKTPGKEQETMVQPDVASVDVRTDATSGGKTFDGKEVTVVKFLMNWTATREPDGQWLIKVMHNTRLLDEGIPPIYKK